MRKGGNPARIRNSATIAVPAVGLTGEIIRKRIASKAAAVARLHKVKDDLMLVVSVYPESLRKGRKHFEARYWIVEGFLEEAKLASVSIAGGRASPGDLKEDSFTLRKKGIDFAEAFPSGARLRVAAMDARTRKTSRNAATIEAAEFGGKLGAVDFSYSVQGVTMAP